MFLIVKMDKTVPGGGKSIKLKALESSSSFYTGAIKTDFYFPV